MALPKWLVRLSRSGQYRIGRNRETELVASATPVSKIGDWLIRQGYRLREKEEMAPARGGLRLYCEVRGSSLGKPVFHVFSVRGQVFMGEIRWSNQWRLVKFVPDHGAVFDQRSIAEIHAMMRDFK